MAVAADNHYATSYGSGSTSISFSFEVNLGGTPDTKIALVVMVWHSYANMTSITYDGVSLGAAKASTDTMQVYCKEFGSTDGSKTFAYNQDAGSPIQFLLSSWTGVDQTTPSESWGTASNYGSTASSSSVTCPSNGIVVGGGHNAGYGYTSVGSGNTSLDLYNAQINSWHSYRSSTGQIIGNAAGAATWYALAGALRAASSTASDVLRRSFPRILLNH